MFQKNNSRKSLVQSANALFNTWYEKMKELRERKHVHETPKRKAAPAEKRTRMTVDLSASSVAKATIVVLLLVGATLLLWEVRSILYIFFAALFLATVCNPFVDKLESYRIPRGWGVIVIYLLALLLIATVITMVVPLLAEQLVSIAFGVKQLVEKLAMGEVELPFYDKFQPMIVDFLDTLDVDAIRSYLEKLSSSLGDLAGNTWGTLMSIFSGFFNLFSVLILAFFMSVERSAMGEFFQSIIPARYGHYTGKKLSLIQDKIGAWARGQILICFVIGFMVYVGMSLIGVNYALTLGVLAGCCEMIPYLGPFLAAIPAILIAFNQEPTLALWAFGVYILMQAIEGNVLVPLIMEKAVGISPVVVIIAMMVGFQFFGIFGILIAVPVATSLQLFIQDLQDYQDPSR